MAEKDFQLQKRDLESQINEAQEAFHSKSTLNESALNLSNEKDSKILELEETLDNSVQEYENQLNAMQTVFKKKLAGYKQFSLPYELDRDQLKHNLNEHCSDEIVQAIKQIVCDGFKNNKSLANVMNYVR